MKPSQLKAIIQRLESMTKDDATIGQRRFENNGEERALVRYNKESESFELEDHSVNETFQFDDIDLVAIEIYELIQ